MSEFKVGDEVLVKATVRKEPVDGCVFLALAGAQFVCVPLSHVQEIAEEGGAK